MKDSHTSPAVVLRWRAYGESDKIVTFLTRDFGKVTGIGKGARNSKRRFPNSLELLARVQVRFRQRPEASLAFLEGCELTAANVVTLDAERLAYGAYLAELAEQMTVEWNPAEGIYELLDEALASLQVGPATASLLRAYELKLLEHAGFGSPLERCHQCVAPLGDTAETYFSPSQGAFWCSRCRGIGEGLVALHAGLVTRLRTLREAPLSRCRETSLGDGRDTAAQVTGQLLALHLVRPLKSIRMIAQLTDDRS